MKKKEILYIYDFFVILQLINKFYFSIKKIIDVMKKVFNLSLLMAALVMIGFASCKRGEKKPDITNANKTQFYKGGILELYDEGNNSALYIIALLDDGMISQGQNQNMFNKDGNIYIFYLISNADTTNFRPAYGEYTLKEASKNSNIGEIVNVNITPLNKEGAHTGPTTKMIQGAKMIIEANKIIVKGKEFGTNKDINLYYEGNMKWNNYLPNPYDQEPQIPITINMSNGVFTFATFKNWGDYFENNTTDLLAHIFDAENKPNKQLALEFLVSKELTYLPDGTYNITDTKEAGTVVASDGFIPDIKHPGSKIYSGSFFTDLSNNPIKYFYFRKGTVTMSNGNTITVNATSYYGSTINATYTHNETINWRVK
ncbi:MAG: hypothetical protein Q4A56_08350 [Porphyromonadaceae bacterium]|nr:hypothetical protein [Porphyromonadaceae bacterium]